MRITWTDDPIRDFERYDAAQAAELARLPICAECEAHIEDSEAYYINGEWICESCMSSYKREVLPE